MPRPVLQNRGAAQPNPRPRPIRQETHLSGRSCGGLSWLLFQKAGEPGLSAANAALHYERGADRVEDSVGDKNDGLPRIIRIDHKVSQPANEIVAASDRS